MIVRKSTGSILIVVCASIIAASVAPAQDTVLVSYQGRLTDGGGEPITGTPSMTFAIYDGSGVSKWSEAHSSVQVDNGLFDVILGSQTALPDSVFTGEDRYLGITVEGDPEITPRTLLTYAPGAAVAKRVAGDVETGESSLIIKNDTGDSTVVIDADSDRGSPRMSFSIPIDPHYPSLELAASAAENKVNVGFAAPPDPYEPAVQMLSNEAGSQVKVNWAIPPDPCREAIALKADSSGNTLRINSSWPPDPAEPVFEIFSDAANEAVNMSLSQPPDPIMPEFEVAVTGLSTSLRLGQPPDPHAPAVELSSDDAGNKVQVNWSQPPDPMREAITLSADASGNTFRVNCSWPPDPMQPACEILSDASSETVNMRLGAPPDPMTPELQVTANSQTASLRLGQPPDPYAPGFELQADATSGTSIAIYDDIGKVMGTEPSPFHNEGYAINLYDPFNDEVLLGLSCGYDDGPAQASLQMFKPVPERAAWTVVAMYYDSTDGGGTVMCYSDGDSSTVKLTGRDLSFYDGASMTAYINKGGGAAFGQHIGVGVWPITNILHIQQYSPTDPIADAWTVYSSRRWKKNIEPIKGALEKVDRLRGVSFDWETNDRHDIGMIAEEVGEIVPEVVTYEDNGHDAKSIDYGRMTALLVEAIKELKTENEELRSRIERLENR